MEILQGNDYADPGAKDEFLPPLIPQAIGICALLAVALLWVAHRKRRHGGWDWRLVGGAALAVILAGALSYGVFRQQRAPSEIERYIAVYPNAAGLLWVPAVDNTGHWLLETEDALLQVSEFYERYSKERGWKLDRTDARDLLYLRLRKGKIVVNVIGTRKQGRSQLAYQIVQKRPKSGS